MRTSPELRNVPFQQESSRSYRQSRRGWLTADALEALGQTDAARATLQQLCMEFPQSQRLRNRIERMLAKAS